MPSNERLYMIPANGARGGGHTLHRQEMVRSPIVGVGADGPRREVGCLQMKTLERRKYAKLSNAGGGRRGQGQGARFDAVPPLYRTREDDRDA